MKFIRTSRLGASAAFVIVLAMSAGCGKKDRETTSTAPAPSPSASPSPWEGEVHSREAQIDKVIADNRQSFDAFDSGSLGDATLEMIPFVVFRALQDLGPAVLGDTALDGVGFFPRADSPSGHNGITWTRPVAADKTFALRYMTRTCASCHTGRVRLADGSMRLTRGGANTEINL